MVNGYLRALLTIALMCLAGTALGVRLSAGGWLTMVGLLLVGLIPFAVLGILLGHLLSADASAPAVGGIVTLFALLGGVYGFQVATSGPVFEVIKGLPSYWLVQAGKTALGGGGWPAEGWIVIAAWTARPRARSPSLPTGATRAGPERPRTSLRWMEMDTDVAPAEPGRSGVAGQPSASGHTAGGCSSCTRRRSPTCSS